jgi:hypothetical protein
LAVSLAGFGRRIVVLEDSESTSGLVSAVVTGLCARRYGSAAPCAGQLPWSRSSPAGGYDGHRDAGLPVRPA